MVKSYRSTVQGHPSDVNVPRAVALQVRLAELGREDLARHVGPTIAGLIFVPYAGMFTREDLDLVAHEMGPLADVQYDLEIVSTV